MSSEYGCIHRIALVALV